MVSTVLNLTYLAKFIIDFNTTSLISFSLLDAVSDADSMDSYDENCLGIEECLFCSFQSPSMEENISHMTLQHGFFLPDLEYISDLEAFISYLGEI